LCLPARVPCAPWGWVGGFVLLSLVIFHECMHPGSLCVIDRLCAKSVQAVAAAATATARMARGGSRRQIQLHTHTHIHTIRTQSAVEFLDRHLHGAAAPPRLLPSSDRPSIATPFQFVRLFCSKRTPDNARAGQILEELVFNEQLVEKGFASQLVSSIYLLLFILVVVIYILWNIFGGIKEILTRKGVDASKFC
jgi:hypothetical protein